MNIHEALSFVADERVRGHFRRSDLFDEELLRRRERLFNALAFTFALLALASLFLVGAMGWGVYGWYVSVAGSFVVARLCSRRADRCREVREFLKAQALQFGSGAASAGR